MGACCSKKKEPFIASNASTVPEEKRRRRKKEIKVVDKKEVKFSEQTPKEAEATPPMDKKPVFVVARKQQASSANPTTKSEDKSRKEETELHVKNPVTGNNATSVVPKAEQARTSSCTEEEVDAALLQCGRPGRNYSDRKRSYDFDNEMGTRDEEEHVDQKKQQESKPSPNRRTPSRGSPVRRSESPAASSSSNCNRSRLPPRKMVLVPAREKRMPRAAAATAVEAKKVTNVVPNRRNAAPRSETLKSTRISNEKALAHYPAHSRSLSKNSPKKAEQPPCRRTPMAEINGNSINRVHKSKEGEGVRKATQNEPQKKNNQTNWITGGSNSVHDQLPSCRTKKQLEPEIHEDAREPKGRSEADIPDQTRTRSSRNSSRDFDNHHVNAATYTSLLLEDINNYHQRNASLSLPACVYKACSILEAVADLNSSSSAQSNVPTQKESFVESEIAVKDDLMEPTLHKYITVRDLRREMEPQESAGSNSPIRQLKNPVDSNDCHSTSRFNIHEEEKDMAVRDLDVSSRGSNSNSILPGTMSSAVKTHRQLRCSGSAGNGKCGSRAYPSPVASTIS